MSIRLDRVVSMTFLSIWCGVDYTSATTHFSNEDPNDPEPSCETEQDEVKQKIKASVVTMVMAFGHDRPFR